MKESLKLQGEELDEVKALITAAGPIDVTPDMYGVIPFEQYLKIFSVVVTMQVRKVARHENENKEERRALLESGDQQKFAVSVTKGIQEQAKAKQQVLVTVLSELAIEEESYMRCGKALKDNPEPEKAKRI